MKLCFCRFLLALGIVVLAIFFFGEPWAKWVIVAAGAILAIMSLFYNVCCCRMKKEAVAK
jgi:membrane protein YdbS with pleckstrin-like domain